MRIAYFVHELADPAVRRRVRMFEDGGEGVRILGFERIRDHDAAAAPGRVLGQTRNGAFATRLLSVALAIPRALRFARDWRDADLVVARNLEMLALALIVTRLAGVRPRIVYECLDIHRLMLGKGAVSNAIRAAERFCLRRVDAIVTSSPAFERNYFRAVQHFAGPVVLAENKVLDVSGAMAQRTTDAPWVVAWCGVLRCRRSLSLLRALAAAQDGRVKIELWGAPALDQIPDFHDQVAASPNLSFNGRYEPTDLARIYGAAHFAWAIDFYEAGGNSDWLLPNRLYESLAFGATPIAIADVETARWLEANRVGVVLQEPIEQSLSTWFEGLNPSVVAILSEAVLALDPSATRMTPATRRALIDQIVGVAT